MKRQRVGRNDRRRPAKGNVAAPLDIWSVPESLPEVKPVIIAQDVEALVRSLGEPPMSGGRASLDFLEMVVQRSAALAYALALSADLVAEQDA